eukprot:gene5643-7659_t
MHYTTMGAETTDKTQVGFYVLKTPPKYIKRSVVIGDFALYIPAGEARHKEVAYMTFPADAYLYTLYPHAHYRGFHVELKARLPDGREKMLLSLPKYDFNWQRDYDPVEPILVKAGTRLIATWVYDNSVHNPANPDPKRNVTWGEQTPDEMMYFRLNYRWVDETVERGDDARHHGEDILDPVTQLLADHLALLERELLLMDVGAGSEPACDRAVAVADRQCPAQHPAIGPVGVAQAIFDLIGFAGRQRMTPHRPGALLVLGVEHAAPPLAIG